MNTQDVCVCRAGSYWGQLLDMAAAAALVCIAALSSSELATVTPVAIKVLRYRH